MQLKDVPVLITGGGSGLGAATARRDGREGAKVAVLDVRKENADKVAEEVKGLALGADVTNEEQVKAAIAKAEAAHGIARVLVELRRHRQRDRAPSARTARSRSTSSRGSSRST